MWKTKLSEEWRREGTEDYRPSRGPFTGRVVGVGWSGCPRDVGPQGNGRPAGLYANRSRDGDDQEVRTPRRRGGGRSGRRLLEDETLKVAENKNTQKYLRGEVPSEGLDGRLSSGVPSVHVSWTPMDVVCGLTWSVDTWTVWTRMVSGLFV